MQKQVEAIKDFNLDLSRSSKTATSRFFKINKIKITKIVDILVRRWYYNIKEVANT